MGKNTVLKTVILLALSIIIFASFSLLVFAKTCIIDDAPNPYTCYIVPTEVSESDCTQNFGGVVDNRAGSQIVECTEGCCCDLNIGQKYVTQEACDSSGYGSSFVETSSTDCVNECDSTTPKACLSTACESYNLQDCKCGNSVADTGWCCAADSTLYVNQPACQVNACNPSELFSVSGTVVNETGGPLWGVSLSTDKSQYAISKSPNGHFTLYNIPLGFVDITASLQGYQTEIIRNIDVQDTILDLEIILVSQIEFEGCDFTLSNRDSANWNYDKDNCLAKYDSHCPNAYNEGDLGCGDGFDNDCDNLYDCNDPDCFNSVECTSTTPYSRCGDNNVDTPNHFGKFEQCEFDSDCSINEVCFNCECFNESAAICGDGVIDENEMCDPKASNQSSKWQCLDDQACNVITCQCIVGKRNCGDGVLDEPQEKCEFESSNSLVSGSYCGFEQCIPEGEPGACLCSSNELCGNLGSTLDLGEECDIGNPGICGAGNCNYATCECKVCNDNQKRPLLFNSTSVDQITLTWTIDCDNSDPNIRDHYEIGRCYVATGQTACIPQFYETIPFSQTDYAYTFTVDERQSGVNIGFDVTVVYESGDEKSSNIVYKNAPDFGCTDDMYDYFCEGNTIMRCVDGVKEPVDDLNFEPDCSNTQFYPGIFTCIDFPRDSSGNNARCVEQLNCDFCNGWYEMFSSVDKQIYPGVYCSQILSCFIDSTNTTVDKYQECNAVATCYDYKSKSSCTQNQCQINNCQWNELDSFSALGIGVCAPTDINYQNCDECNYDNRNNFFGRCRQETCELYGSGCYYDRGNLGSPNFNFGQNSGLTNPPECKNKNEVTCQDYANEDDCNGGQNSELDNSWSSNGLSTFPISGTNNHNPSSLDFLKIGLCRWGTIQTDFGQQQACFKDGNGDKERDCVPSPYYSTWDGKQNGYRECFKDIYPPESYISYTEPLKKELDITFAVNDDETNGGGYFHFNIVPYGQTCYPDGYIGSDKVIELGDGQTEGVVNADTFVSSSGLYTICYFGEDAHYNFENTVHTETVLVDADLPEVTYSYEKVTYQVDYQGDLETVTDITMDLSLDEEADCSFWLNSAESGLYGGQKITRRTNHETIQYNALKDGAYTMKAVCMDSAGNYNTVLNQSLYINIEADTKISNFKPDITFGPIHEDINGKIEIILEADTEDNADCRYGLTDDWNNSMTGMNTFNGINHEKLLIYPDDFPKGEGIKNYLVRCDFGGDIGVYGNSGDYIRFAIDNTPPFTIFVDEDGQTISEPDINNWYSELDIYLKCQEDEMKYNENPDNPDWAAGCEEVQWAIYPDALQSTGLDPIQITLDQDGYHEIYWRSKDTLGNYEPALAPPKTYKIDSEQYSFDIIIYDTSIPDDVTTITWNKPYEVYITSNKSENFDPSYDVNIENFELVIKGYRFSFADTIYENPLTAGSGAYQWIASINLPMTRTLKNYEGEGFFVIKAVDSHGVSSENVLSGNPFYIDTNPPEEPILDPAFEPGPNSFEWRYEDIFNEKNGLYYTNDESLFVTGKTEEIGNVYYHVNDIFAYSGAYDTSQNADKDYLLDALVNYNYNEDSTTLTFNGDYVSGEGQFKTGNFILINGAPRRNYTHYDGYYEIIDSIVSGGTGLKITTITIAPDLEYDVPADTTVYAYNARYPYNWFGMPLNLTKGWNTFTVKLLDNVGNLEQTPIYDIYFDPDPPELETVYPINGTILAKKYTAVTVKIIEFGAGLDDEYIELLKNGVSVDYTRLTNVIDGGDLPPLHNETIIYQEPGGFEDGVYTFQIKVKDLARGEIDYEWSFEIDSKRPSEPTFALVGVNPNEHVDINLAGSTWYTNEIKDFTLEYEDNAKVEIRSIDLYTVTYQGLGVNENFEKRDAATCIRDSPNTNFFTCSFNNESMSYLSDDKDYAIAITAYKILDGDEISQDVEHFKYFTLDRVEPNYTLSYDNITNSNANMTFTASVDQGEKELRAFIGLNGGDLTELEPVGGYEENLNNYLYSKPYQFNWNVDPTESNDYYFTFILRDYAGNEKSSTHWIRIDNEPPIISIANIIPGNRYVSDLEPHKIFTLDELEKIGKENARFAGTALTIKGTITESSNGYDIKRITIKKMDKNGTLFNPSESPLELPVCRTKNNPKDCYLKGDFYINDYLLEGRPEIDTPNYLLFEVEDEAENIVLYTLYLVSDRTQPKEPLIIIFE